MSSPLQNRNDRLRLLPDVKGVNGFNLKPEKADAKKRELVFNMSEGVMFSYKLLDLSKGAYRLSFSSKNSEETLISSYVKYREEAPFTQKHVIELKKAPITFELQGGLTPVAILVYAPETVDWKNRETSLILEKIEVEPPQLLDEV